MSTMPQVTQCADQYIEAFCSARGPDIFRSIAYPTEIWTPDPLDVETIHTDARDVFEHLLNRAVAKDDRSKVGRMLLLLGESGSGKTHLMRALRTRAHQRGDGYFAYMQMTSASGNYGRYVLHKVIDSFDKPYCSSPDNPSEVTGLMQLSTAVADVCKHNRKNLQRLRDEEAQYGRACPISRNSCVRSGP